MPKIKVKRDDILRKPEIDTMLKKAESVYNGQRLQCVIALAWLFGKRINEICRLKRKDIWWDNQFLYVRFHVSKKRERKEQPVPKPFLKRIRLDHPYVHYILDYVKKFEKGYIFPGYGGGYVKQVKDKKYGKTYEYVVEGGHITPERLRQQLKQVNPKAWWHLFRESLATYMAENGATEEELMHWFDWDRFETAHKYVKRGVKLTEKWSERSF